MSEAPAWTSESLEQYLREAAQRTPPVPGWHYAGPQGFVLKHGQAYVPKPIPHKFRRWGGDISECYANAWRLARATDLIYVEGFAAGSYPRLHAWCAEPGSNRAIDPTWKKGMGTAYFGVAFDKLFIERYEKTPGLPVFDDGKANPPILRNLIPETTWRSDGASFDPDKLPLD